MPSTILDRGVTLSYLRSALLRISVHVDNIPLLLLSEFHPYLSVCMFEGILEWPCWKGSIHVDSPCHGINFDLENIICTLSNMLGITECSEFCSWNSLPVLPEIRDTKNQSINAEYTWWQCWREHWMHILTPVLDKDRSNPSNYVFVFQARK